MKSNRGMGIIQLIISIVVIAIIVALGVYFLRMKYEQAKVQTAKTDMLLVEWKAKDAIEKQTVKGNEESFNLPKNIRQIGIPNEKYRIYIEDYVYTFLKKIAEKAEEEEKGAAAVFTGEIKWDSGTGYLFIRGALAAETGEISAEHVEFSDLTWQKLHEETEHYFAGQEIIGWFLTQKSLQMEVTECVQRIHMKLFCGEKALMLMDPVEKEEAFF